VLRVDKVSKVLEDLVHRDSKVLKVHRYHHQVHKGLKELKVQRDRKVLRVQ